MNMSPLFVLKDGTIELRPASVSGLPCPLGILCDRLEIGTVVLSRNPTMRRWVFNPQSPATKQVGEEEMHKPRELKPRPRNFAPAGVWKKPGNAKPEVQPAAEEEELKERPEAGEQDAR